MIALDDVNTDAGCLQHLLLAEALTPSYGAYKFEEAQTVLMAMKAVIVNRKALGKEYVFCSKGAKSVIDFICAPVSQNGCQAKQFEGFSLNASGKVVIASGIIARIKDAVAIANNPRDTRSIPFAKHVNEAIAVARNNVSDPFKNIPAETNHESVLKGAYGWRTAASASPGGLYVKIPQVMPPLTHPNGSIQGIQFYTIKSEAQLINENEFDRLAV